MKYSNIINGLDGWCSRDKMIKMYNLVIYTRPELIVEIGVFAGKSLLSQAFGLKDNNFGKIIGIDSWSKNDCIEYMNNPIAIKWWNELDYEKIYNQCISAIDEHDLRPYVHLIKSTSTMCVSEIPDNIDILHIDGNHEEMSSCRDVELYVPKIKQGGYLWFDDANWHQTQKAVNLIEKKYGLVLMDKARSDDPNNFCNLYRKI